MLGSGGRKGKRAEPTCQIQASELGRLECIAGGLHSPACPPLVPSTVKSHTRLQAAAIKKPGRRRETEPPCFVGPICPSPLRHTPARWEEGCPAWAFPCPPPQAPALTAASWQGGRAGERCCNSQSGVASCWAFSSSLWKACKSCHSLLVSTSAGRLRALPSPRKQQTSVLFTLDLI